MFRKHNNNINYMDVLTKTIKSLRTICLRRHGILLTSDTITTDSYTPHNVTYLVSYTIIFGFKMARMMSGMTL